MMTAESLSFLLMPIRLPVVLTSLAFALLLIRVIAPYNVASIDLWGKLSIPAWWVANGVFPTTDPFSFTAPHAPWTDHEWLAGFAFYSSLLLGGDPGLSLLKYSMIGLMSAAVFYTVHRTGASVLLSFVILLLLGLPSLETGFLSTGRPQIFTFAFLPCLIALLESIRPCLMNEPGRFPRRLLWLAPFGCLWANLHGGFVAGLGTLGIYTGAMFLTTRSWQATRPLVLATALFALPSLINPYGVDYWRYLFYAVTLNRVAISEWHPVPLWDDSFLPIKLMAVLSALVFLAPYAVPAARKQPRNVTAALMLAVLCYLAFKHLKHHALLAIGAAIYLPQLATDPAMRTVLAQLPLTWTAWTHRFPRWQWFPEAFRLGMPLGLFMAGILMVWPYIAPTSPETLPLGLTVQVRTERDDRAGFRAPPYPVGAVDFLARSGLRGNLMTPFMWGEYAYWRLYPRFLISVDGRLEAVYPMETFNRIQSFYTTAGVNWRVADQAGADYILLEKKLVRGPRRPDGGIPVPDRWHVLYNDPHYAVLGKQLPDNGLVATDAPTMPRYLPVTASFHPAEDAARFSARPHP
jgi:hypothetical protein